MELLGNHGLHFDKRNKLLISNGSSRGYRGPIQCSFSNFCHECLAEAGHFLQTYVDCRCMQITKVYSRTKQGTYHIENTGHKSI